MTKRPELKKNLLLALKIAVGSSAAIFIAEFADLQFAASAGSITLLTLLTTKLETMRLSAYRLITFAAAAVLACVVFINIPNDWIAYGIYTFFVVFMSHLFGLKATVSVNAVIGTHFLSADAVNTAFVMNELLLVVIGIAIAVILNMFHDYHGYRKEIRDNMRYTEEHLRLILEEAAEYLFDPPKDKDVWHDVRELEAKIQAFVHVAYEYQDNTFVSHPQYYIEYFEMRLEQCKIIHSLHYELKKMRSVPRQAKIIAEYILYLSEYVIEINHPYKQLRHLAEIINGMKSEPLPVSREEFEARAMLYHVLMDLEEFLNAKKRFADNLDDDQLKRYWTSDKN